MYGNVRQYAEDVWQYIKDIGKMYGNIKQYEEYEWKYEET